MDVRLHVVTSLSALMIVACGGAGRGDAKAPEADPWAGYKGTYATAAGASGPPATRMKAAKKDAAPSDAPKDAPVLASDATPATAAPAAAPTSAKKGKTGGGKAAAKAKKK